MTADDEKRLDAIADEVVDRVVRAMATMTAMKADFDQMQMLAHNVGTVCQEHHDRGNLNQNEIGLIVERVEFRLSDF